MCMCVFVRFSLAHNLTLNPVFLCVFTPLEIVVHTGCYISTTIHLYCLFSLPLFSDRMWIWKYYKLNEAQYIFSSVWYKIFDIVIMDFESQNVSVAHINMLCTYMCLVRCLLCIIHHSFLYFFLISFVMQVSQHLNWNVWQMHSILHLLHLTLQFHTYISDDHSIRINFV